METLVAKLGSVSMVLNLLIVVYSAGQAHEDKIGIQGLIATFFGGAFCGGALIFVGRIPRRKAGGE